MILIGLVHVILSYTAETEAIGAFYEKDEYEREYYVNLFAESSASACQQVPGMIWVYTADYSDEETTRLERFYHLEYVRFPNGNRLEFDPMDSLELNEKIWVSDVNGRIWKAQLTNIPVPPKRRGKIQKLE